MPDIQDVLSARTVRKCTRLRGTRVGSVIC